MATYYVKNDGDDSADGLSDSTAWATISKVNGETLSPGDEVRFKRGDLWRETLDFGSNDGAPGNHIYFGAYGVGAKPRISGSDLITTWSDEGSNVWSASVAVGSFDPELVLFDGVVGTEEASQGAVNAANEWYFDTATDTLYVYSTADPDTAFTSPGIEAGIRNNCIISILNDYLTVEDFTLYGSTRNCYDITRSVSNYVRNVDVEKTGYDGISVTHICDDIQISDCVLTGELDLYLDSGKHGIQISQGASGRTVTNLIIERCIITGWHGEGIAMGGWNTTNRSDTATIRDCTITGNGGAAVYPRWYDNVTISNCDLSNNNISTAWTGTEQYGVGVRSSSNVVVEDCVIDNNGIHGIEVWGGNDATDGTSDNVVVRRCQITNNGDASAGNGIMISATYVTNNDFHHNIIAQNNQSGIYLGGTGTGHRVLNNTIYDNAFDQVRVASAMTVAALQNNILDAGTGQECLDDIGAGGSITTHTNNLYYKSSGTLVTWAATNYTYSDVLTWEATAQRDYPDLNSDYTLRQVSPAVDGGTTVAGITDGYLGSAPDIGALESSFILGANILHDSERVAVIAFVNNGDTESDQLKVDVSELSANGSGEACTGVAIESMWYDVSSDIGVDIKWDATANVTAWSVFGDGTFDISDAGPIENNAGAGKTGDIVFSTVGTVGANSRYYIVMTLRKSY